MQKKTVVPSILLLPLLLYSSEISLAEKPKSSTTGVLLSIGSTVVPVGLGCLIYGAAASKGNDTFMWCGGLLAASGAILGPDAGHFYAQQWSKGGERAGIRFTIGLAMMLSASYLVVGGIAGSLGASTSEDGTAHDLSYSILILSTAAYVGYTVWDIATVPGSVREYNSSITKSDQLNFCPYLDVPNGKYGLSLVYNF
ncbi:MAG: hypothetical protein OEV79_11820 [candidate division WOR-3 bacterium]|nr:hypothetical protein [candidate division WOR-3 bacterium]